MAPVARACLTVWPSFREPYPLGPSVGPASAEAAVAAAAPEARSETVSSEVPRIFFIMPRLMPGLGRGFGARRKTCESLTLLCR